MSNRYKNPYESAKKKRKKATKRIVVFISEEVHDEFTSYCDQENYMRPKLIELILEEFLDKWGVESPED